MVRKLKNILVTGGSGFIGSNFIRYLLNCSASKNFNNNMFNDSNFDGIVVNVDCLTYAGNNENLTEIETKYKGKKYFFEKANICDKERMEEIFRKYDIDTVVHFAAESHVDRSITGPENFINTNIIGTFTLLETARKYWTNKDGSIKDNVLFHHISTDEVYGSLGSEGFFTEGTPYSPRSPYSASKASSDHIVLSYYYTYGLPVTISNCSNNYGPYQFPEKLIPLMISNIINNKSLPIYGKGDNIRDWIYVEDHNRAIWLILNKGIIGEKYNIGGDSQWENVKLLEKIIQLTCSITGQDINKVYQNICYVKDRPGHDKRYAIDCSKIKNTLGWERKMTFEQGLKQTILWYLDKENKIWLNRVLSGEYKNWIKENYQNR